MGQEGCWCEVVVSEGRDVFPAEENEGPDTRRKPGKAFGFCLIGAGRRPTGKKTGRQHKTMERNVIQILFSGQ